MKFLCGMVPSFIAKEIEKYIPRYFVKPPTFVEGSISKRLLLLFIISLLKKTNLTYYCIIQIANYISRIGKIKVCNDLNSICLVIA